MSYPATRRSIALPSTSNSVCGLSKFSLAVVILEELAVCAESTIAGGFDAGDTLFVCVALPAALNIYRLVR
jgi:hypothetical protein